MSQIPQSQMQQPQAQTQEPSLIEGLLKGKANIGQCEYTPLGESSAIKLNVNIVRQFFAKPTKSGVLIDDTSAMRFIALCKSRCLNPFEGDCFVVGYDDRNSQSANWTLITSIQAFLKRAEKAKNYDGMQSGIVVQDKDEQIVERVGDFQLPGDVTLGGWARVHLKDRKFPVEKRLNLESRQKGTDFWSRDPAGMICKCAEADALREAFPTTLGGMYVAGEEVSINNIQFDVPDQIPERKATAAAAIAALPKQTPAKLPDRPVVPAPVPKAPNVEQPKPKPTQRVVTPPTKQEPEIAENEPEQQQAPIASEQTKTADAETENQEADQEPQAEQEFVAPKNWSEFYDRMIAAATEVGVPEEASKKSLQMWLVRIGKKGNPEKVSLESLKLAMFAAESGSFDWNAGCIIKQK